MPKKPTYGELQRRVAELEVQQQQQTALHESEEKFRVAQELSPDGFTILRPVRDEHGQIVDFTWVYENAAIARLNGTNHMAVVGRRVLALFPNHAETPFYKAYVEVAESGEQRIVEAQYQGGGVAEPKWLRVTVVRTGQDICIFGQNITERKNAEALLKADLAALTQMHMLSGCVMDSEGLQPLLQQIMDAAIEIVGAEKGTLQLLEGDSLRIVAHHGHRQPFLEFFETAETRASVCGEATRLGERVIVPDVETSSLFEGTLSLSVLRNAGVRAVQSTPISSRTGTLLGILTTQWGAPYIPDEHNLWRLDLLARQAADLIEHARAEEALRKSEEKFRGLFYWMGGGIQLCELVFDAEGQAVDNIILDVNPAYEKQTGLSRDQVVGRRIKEMLPIVERAWLDRCREVVRKGVTMQFEEYNSSLDKWFEVFANPMGGNRFAAVFADITERKRTEEALRWQNAIQQSTQAVLNAAMTCATEEELGRACLAEAEKLSESKFGFLDEINAEGQLDVIAISDPGWDASRIPLSQRQPPRSMTIRGIYGRVIHGGKGFFTNDPAAHADFVGLPPGHPPLTAFLGVPLIREGRAIGIIAVGNREGGYTKTQQDALEALMPAIVEAFIRKRAEEALRESGQRLTALVQSAPVGIVIHGPDGRLLHSNPMAQELLGVSGADALAKDLTDPAWKFLREDESAMPVEEYPVSQVLARQAPVENLVLGIQHGNPEKLVWVLVNAVPRMLDDGSVAEVIVTFTNISDRKQAEEKIFESNQRFWELMNALPVGVSFSDDPTCQRITGNPALLAQFEITPEDNISASAPDPAAAGRLVRFFQDGREIQDFELPLQRAAAENRKISSIDLEVLLPSGRRWFASASGAPVHNQRGDVVGGVAVTMDVTERKRTEQALRESDERLRMAQSAANIGIWEWQLQSDTLAWTPELEQIYGYAAGTFPGNYAGFSERVHPDDLAEVERQWNAAVKAHRPFDFDFRVRPSEAETRWINCKGAAVYDQAGHPQRVYGVNVDITERKWAEDALRESENRFRTLAENNPFIIERFDRQHRYIYLNPAAERLTLRPAQEHLGKTARELGMPDELCILWEESQDRAFAGEQVTKQFQITDPSGRQRTLLDLFAPEYSADGSIKTVIVISQDITEIAEAQAALCESEDRLREANTILEQKVRERTQELAQRALQLQALTGELTLSEQRERSRLAKVLHDHLQQLLVAAKFRLTVLGRGGDDVVKQATKEVEELIDESITASRSLTAELSPPILHEAGLKEGLQWLARRMAEKHGLFVNLEMEEHEPLSEQLKILLFESVRELLFNVVKHARTSSANVSLRHVDSHLQVTVSDQGAGFDSATMSIVGEERKGFGLFAIRERLGFMGGTLQIQSIPGQGSLFVLSVPIALTEKIEPQSQEIGALPESFLMPSEHPDPGQKIMVMLADDHAVVRQGIANLLGDEPDIEVMGQAADGQEAVEMAARLLPHVILMDMSMPKLNGVEATRIIHNDWPDIRIIGLSMFEGADRAQAMRDAGAVDYMSKSGQPEELIRAIRTAASRSKKSFSAKST